MFTKPMVYVAGPYTNPEPVENAHYHLVFGMELIEEGMVTPVVPHNTMLWHLVTPRPINLWYVYDIELMKKCDAVLRLPGESWGADTEVREAAIAGIPVFHDKGEMYEYFAALEANAMWEAG